MSLPKDWTKQVHQAIQEISKDGAKELFGLRFPEEWRSELLLFARNGELGRLFKLKTIAFGGKTIAPLPDPNENRKIEGVRKVG